MNSSKVFLLGEEDFEMEIIESLLQKYKLPYGYALFNGQRVRRNLAYCSNSTSLGSWEVLKSYDSVIAVECDHVVNDNELISKTVYIDCHRINSPYYGLSYSSYFERSSLGQLLDYLDYKKPIPSLWRYIVAADYPLDKAYSEYFFAIYPEELFRVRISLLARKKGISYRVAYEDCKRFRNLVSAKSSVIRGCRIANLVGYRRPFVGVIDCALIEKVNIIMSETEDNRTKIMMIGSDAKALSMFISGKLVPEAEQIVGDFKQYYAFGYIRSKML